MDDYIAKVHRLRKAVRARVQAEDLTPDQGAMAVSEELAPIAFEDPKVRAALDKLKGRDRVGVMGEGPHFSAALAREQHWPEVLRAWQALPHCSALQAWRAC